MTRVGFVGDTHGNLLWVQHVLGELNKVGVTTVYQLGDFGLWTGDSGKKFLRRTNLTLGLFGQTMYVILGNHEHYPRVKFMRTDDDGLLFLKDYPNIKFLPRGHAWTTENGVRMAALGGAGSIDRALRTEDVDWWAEEAITDEDCAALVANVRALGWDHVDVMLTHEAPAGLRRIGFPQLPSWVTPEIEHYTWTQRVLLRDTLDRVEPLWLLHGHWHQWYRDEYDGENPDNQHEYTCQVIGLNMDGTPRNTVVATLDPIAGLTDMLVLTNQTWNTLI